MTTLYIIGNGFDLYHGLPTSYSEFYAFAKKDLNELEETFYLKLDEIEPWGGFENKLGEYDWQLVYDVHNDIDVMDDSFRPSMAFGLEDELTEVTDNLVSKIEEQFHFWIDSIDVKGASRRLNLDSNGIYLSFNYTPTLQCVYGISDNQINHIHGSVSGSERLVYGHTETMAETPELEENGDSNRTMFTDAENAAKYPFHAFRKPVEQIIANNEHWCLELKGRIDRVVVIGHSLNIDLPYFKKINDVVSGVPWIVSYHTEDEQKKHMLTLRSIGLEMGGITQCQHDDLSKHI
ncbi:hypothetical protein G9409_11380 [Chlorobium sp. BLA1]|uniref:bacteriophage abortive infection AbiH family protein n=1 Tax=Candidatus Chlorobium masyuteum TaxID=2716876 RepID=UPI0014206278|nr:bacteriophage abortive infection AbiH family protein [Candidatus Chlorobium masyuteum]NHQ61172.1 hypothetical protein [Candidatus Chlorobium masyuteum]NTU44413.1 hypothetical protein [Chlorobiaceae bacterium]